MARMGRKASLKPHLTVTELKAGYLDCHKAADARRWQLVWLVARGQPISKSARLVGYSLNHAHRVIQNYNRRGADAIKDGRTQNQICRRSLLSPSEVNELRDVLHHPPADGGLWTGPKVALWIAQKIGRDKVHPQRGWDYLKKIGLTLRIPRRRHAKANKAAQEEFKKRD